jgi:hypothetical protein
LTPVWLGCPPQGFETEAVCCFGEAGVICDYTENACAYGPFCIPNFEETELSLIALEGGSAEASLAFAAQSPSGLPCSIFVTPFDSWVSAVAVRLDWPDFRLDVTADASLLSPGDYETFVRVSPTENDYVGRCVHVSLEVRSAANVGDPPEQGTTVLSWGRIKSGYR